MTEMDNRRAVTSPRAIALRLLKVRPRTKRELEVRLTARGVSAQEAVAVVADLEAAGWLDDDSFARLWIAWRTGRGPIGRRRLEQELMGKGVNSETISRCLDQELANINERELAYEAGEKYSQRVKGDGPAVRRKLWSYLIRRGFLPEAVSDAVSRLLPDE